jgi:hypothetical protein
MGDAKVLGDNRARPHHRGGECRGLLKNGAQEHISNGGPPQQRPRWPAPRVLCAALGLGPGSPAPPADDPHPVPLPQATKTAGATRASETGSATKTSTTTRAHGTEVSGLLCAHVLIGLRWRLQLCRRAAASLALLLRWLVPDARQAPRSCQTHPALPRAHAAHAVACNCCPPGPHRLNLHPPLCRGLLPGDVPAWPHAQLRERRL